MELDIDKHDQVKDLFRLFVKPSEFIEGNQNKNRSNSSTTNGNGEGQRKYNNAQKIGLIAGSLAFIITLLFISPGNFPPTVYWTYFNSNRPPFRLHYCS